MSSFGTQNLRRQGNFVKITGTFDGYLTNKYLKSAFEKKKKTIIFLILNFQKSQKLQKFSSIIFQNVHKFSAFY